MQDLHIKQVSPMKLYCDNKAACDIAHNPVQHDWTKHVDVDRHFIKEKLEEKLIEVPHVRSQDQLADFCWPRQCQTKQLMAISTN